MGEMKRRNDETESGRGGPCGCPSSLPEMKNVQIGKCGNVEMEGLRRWENT